MSSFAVLHVFMTGVANQTGDADFLGNPVSLLHLKHLKMEYPKKTSCIYTCTSLQFNVLCISDLNSVQQLETQRNVWFLEIWMIIIKVPRVHESQIWYCTCWSQNDFIFKDWRYLWLYSSLKVSPTCICTVNHIEILLTYHIFIMEIWKLQKIFSKWWLTLSWSRLKPSIHFVFQITYT